MLDDLTAEETAVLIDYARRCYAEERWPLSPELREVRAAIETLRARPAALPPPQPAGEPTWAEQVKRRKRR